MKSLIGDKKFYRTVILLIIPIILQSLVSNFVNMLDNIMVGSLGTEEMSGVSIMNQMMQVYNIGLFGAVSGAGIFCAQYFGNKDYDGVRNAVRIKIIICGLVTLIAFAVFIFWSDPLIRMFLHDDTSGSDLQQTLELGKTYLRIMLVGFIPFLFSNVFSSTLRESGETVLPMKASIIAVVVNFAGNYLLIFGAFGAPRLGVEGAAIATVIARFVECAVIVVGAYRQEENKAYLKGLFRSMRVPAPLAKDVAIKGTPLILNEVIWAAGQAVLMQCYSLRGLEAVAALSISGTLTTMFNVVYWSMGGAISIMVGQMLGAGKLEEARATANKLIFAATTSCVVAGGLLFASSGFFPAFFNTTDTARHIARSIICVSAVAMPLNAFMHCCYFTLRSGGKTIITFVFDSVMAWVMSIPIAFVLSRYTDISIVLIVICVTSADLIKCALGFILVKKGVWVQNIIEG